MASEMLYPIMPVYLQSIGFSIALIGVLEGIAEATAGLSKGYFGKYSDYTGKRVPFVQLGYALSAISKPLMAVFVYPLWIFGVRTIDRFGKGIRTGARDALLSGECTTATRARIFGFHRSLDTLGAVIGPALALLFLYLYPGEYKTLFYVAFLPGVLAIVASFLLKDKHFKKPVASAKPSLFTFLKYWKVAPSAYRKLCIGLLAFALINSSDVFLLLMLKESGVSDVWVIGIYIFYNLVYAIAAYPLGILADKIGLKRIFIVGLLLFSMVYFGMAAAPSNIYIYGILFFFYGLYAASTEGISKAWISNISAPENVGTAIGTFSGLQSICSMVASSAAGLVWYNYGAAPLFYFASGGALLLVFYFVVMPYHLSEQFINENKMKS